MAGQGKPLTGRTVFALFAGAFGVILAVNLTLAWYAVGTFPGLEVQNGYVASQSFDRDRQAQEALGWVLEPAYTDGMLTLDFTGPGAVPVAVQELSVLVGRATETVDDIRPAFAGGPGRYATAIDLAPGKWLIRVEALAQDGTLFRQRRTIHVGG